MKQETVLWICAAINLSVMLAIGFPYAWPCGVAFGFCIGLIYIEYSRKAK